MEIRDRIPLSEEAAFTTIINAAIAGDREAAAWIRGEGTIVVTEVDAAFVRWDEVDGRNSKRYIDWRKAIFQRDQYTCSHCGARGALQAHHIQHWADYPSKRFDLSNGITLCVICHALEHPHLAVVAKGRSYGG